MNLRALTIVSVMALCAGTAVTSHAAVTIDDLGTGSVLPVHNGWDGVHADLGYLLSHNMDPTTHSLAPITSPTGAALVMGNVDQGENPAVSSQVQVQRYLVTGQDAPISVTYLGSHAGYLNILGVYTYAANLDPNTAPLTMTPLLRQNVDPLGQTTSFVVPVGNYFGFYLSANGGAQQAGIYYSENFRNADGSARNPMDHFITFNSNIGEVFGVEDLSFDGGSGLMGDQDFQDLIFSVTLPPNTPSNNPPPTPTPEPATVGLVAMGMILTLGPRPRKQRK